MAKARTSSKMKRFYFSTKVIMNGCDAVVLAETEEEAREKIFAGKWERIDLDTGEMVDWNPDSRPNNVETLP